MISKHEKCLSNESLEMLFQIAEKGTALTFSRQDDIKIICSLVESGHIFQGALLNDAPSSNYYSITKKGFLTLQCNLLWNTCDEVNAQQQVVAHLNDSKHNCSKGCLSRGDAVTKCVKSSAKVCSNNYSNLRTSEETPAV
jgi:hypothetical protein